MVNRIKRVNELIRQELSRIIKEQFNYKGTLITVSCVKTAQDLRTAKASISIFPYKKSLEILKSLEEEFPKIQQILNQSVELKYIPKIKLEIDETFEYGDKIESLIKKIKSDNIES